MKLITHNNGLPVYAPFHQHCRIRPLEQLLDRVKQLHNEGQHEKSSNLMRAIIAARLGWSGQVTS